MAITQRLQVFKIHYYSILSFSLFTLVWCNLGVHIFKIPRFRSKSRLIWLQPDLIAIDLVYAPWTFLYDS